MDRTPLAALHAWFLFAQVHFRAAPDNSFRRQTSIVKTGSIMPRNINRMRHVKCHVVSSDSDSYEAGAAKSVTAAPLRLALHKIAPGIGATSYCV